MSNPSEARTQPKSAWNPYGYDARAPIGVKTEGSSPRQLPSNHVCQAQAALGTLASICVSENTPHTPAPSQSHISQTSQQQAALPGGPVSFQQFPFSQCAAHATSADLRRYWVECSERAVDVVAAFVFLTCPSTANITHWTQSRASARPRLQDAGHLLQRVSV